MNQNVTAGVVAVFLGVLGLVALAVGGLGGSTTVTIDSGPSVPSPTKGEGGLVYGKHETGGIVLFGMELKPRDRWLSVGFVAPDECIEQDDEGEDVVVTSGACAALPASGVAKGGGRTMDGVEWVQVRVDVSRKCFEVVERGDEWPSDAAECREG